MLEYATVFHAGYHYYFGGYESDSNMNKTAYNSILRLEESSWSWSKVGEIKTSRYAPGVIMIEDKFMVIGGEDFNSKSYEIKNEACLKEDDKIECTEMDWMHKALNPALFLVGDSYADC